MEKILRVPFKEITLLRLVCNQCRGSLEVALDRLGTAAIVCPGCSREFRRPESEQTLRELAKSIQFLQTQKDFDFQFVLNAD